MWEQLSLVSQDTPEAAGWDRVTRLRAGSALAGCGTGGMGCGSCLGLKRGEMGMETITGGRVWLQPVQP